MDDVVAIRNASDTRPRLDLQEHLADLEAKGLLARIDHPVDKDTELHPLVRLQFIGGIPEAQRRAFLFTNVVDGSGRRYDIPVVVGAIAASAEIYSLGMRREVGEIGAAWLAAIANPIPPVRVTAPPCQEVVITGDALRAPRRRHEALPGADLDPRLRCRPLSHRHALHHQGSGNRHPEHRHLPGGAQGHRPAGGPHGGARRRGRRLSALAEIPGPQRTDAHRHRDRGSPGRDVHRRPEARHRSRRDRRGGRARRPRGADRPLLQHRYRRSGLFRDRHRGAHRYRQARAGGAVRREQRLCGARSLQHAHAGDRHHAPAPPGLRLHHQPGHAEQIEPGQEGGLRAALSGASARYALGARRAPRHPARAAHQSASGHLRPVRARHRAQRGLARPQRRRRLSGDLRQAA